jgi:hypothetical protein
MNLQKSDTTETLLEQISGHDHPTAYESSTQMTNDGRHMAD